MKTILKSIAVGMTMLSFYGASGQLVTNVTSSANAAVNVAASTSNVVNATQATTNASKSVINTTTSAVTNVSKSAVNTAAATSKSVSTTATIHSTNQASASNTGINSTSNNSAEVKGDLDITGMKNGVKETTSTTTNEVKNISGQTRQTVSSTKPNVEAASEIKAESKATIGPKH